jgi:hypothetical protein
MVDKRSRRVAVPGLLTNEALRQVSNTETNSAYNVLNGSGGADTLAGAVEGIRVLATVYSVVAT